MPIIDFTQKILDENSAKFFEIVLMDVKNTSKKVTMKRLESKLVPGSDYKLQVLCIDALNRLEKDTVALKEKKEQSAIVPKADEPQTMEE